MKEAFRCSPDMGLFLSAQQPYYRQIQSSLFIWKIIDRCGSVQARSVVGHGTTEVGKQRPIGATRAMWGGRTMMCLRGLLPARRADAEDPEELNQRTDRDEDEDTLQGIRPLRGRADDLLRMRVQRETDQERLIVGQYPRVSEEEAGRTSERRAGQMSRASTPF
jgi:hypothetical protein